MSIWEDITMFFDQAKKDYMKNILFLAARLPFIYLVTGIFLFALSIVDNVFPITAYKSLFDITDNIGAIFIALSLLTFIYSFLVYAFQHYEKKLFADHQVASLILGSIRKSLRIIFILIVIDIIITFIGPGK